MDRFDELLCKQMYESDPNFRYCTNAKCHTGQIIVDGGKYPTLAIERLLTEKTPLRFSSVLDVGIRRVLIVLCRGMWDLRARNTRRG